MAAHVRSLLRVAVSCECVIDTSSAQKAQRSKRYFMTTDNARKPANRKMRQSGIPDFQVARLSRRQAAMILGVIPPTLDKLAAMHGLTISQIPGHSRRYFLRSEVEALAAKSFATEARA